MGSRKQDRKAARPAVFGDIIDPDRVVQPEVYERDRVSKVETACGRRDVGPVHALKAHPVVDPRTGRRRLLPPQRVIEILRREHDGASVEVQTVVTSIRDMYRRGTITQEMYDEGVEFKRHFDVARLDGMRVPSLDRIPTGGGQQSDEPARIMHAKDEVFRLMNILGGVNTTRAKALWKIVGMEVSLREMAGESRKNSNFWTGALVVALEILAEQKGRREKRC